MGEPEGSQQQYCLRWNNHSDNIISEFEVLLGQEDFVDVTLSCDKQSIKAHKVVLSACSAYFRRLLKDNPCQHPIIILRDVGYEELRSLLYFMYHGQVMVDQDKIPQLLQTAQLLEVRGLSEIKEEENPIRNAEDIATTSNKGSQSFLAGLLNNATTSTKRSSMSVVSDSCSNSSPTPPPAAKRQRGSATSASRPVPMLQSILPSQLAAPNAPTFDLAMGSSTRALTALANKAQATKTLPTSLENLLSAGTLTSSGLSKHSNNNGGVDIHSTSSSSSEDAKDRLAESSSSYNVLLNRTKGSHGPDLEEADAIVEIKEEPMMHFIEDEFCDEDTNNRTDGGGTCDEESDSEADFSENSGDRGFTLPLLAQHLAATGVPTSSSSSLLTASAKLRAAASQARHLSGGSASDGHPLIAQVIMGPSSPSDCGPASVGSDAASPSDPLEGDPPRKLAFHEPRPCPICRRMYRDAATLRTHTAIMHAEGRDPFACMCGELFRTKYEMYNHKKNGHR